MVAMVGRSRKATCTHAGAFFTTLAVEYLSGEPLPRVGQRLTLVDHDGRPHGVVETTHVTIIPLHLVEDGVWLGMKGGVRRRE